ncbi:MAG: Modification methylase BamHI [Firmicutes bacterium ADurb.Bin419]|nr:MAG: Modification methylase BamHI [Firmicutes bacterium ADurb.Bin419]
MFNAIHLGDCKELIKQIPEESVDLIFTDPPYAREYIHLYEWMAEECPRVMKQGASLITIVGHSTLPEIIEIFENQSGLRFRWPLCMWQPGKRAKLSMGVEVCWKPALHYIKGKFPVVKQRSRGFVSDAVVMPTAGAGTKKKRHKWEQSIEWSNYYIERLTDQNDVVFDPMCGAGTFLCSAKKLGRQYIGFEMDEASYNTAIQYINEF